MNLLSPRAMRTREMKYLFSAEKKFRTWRRLWIALAQAERELGLPVTQEQIDELEAHKDDINYEVAQAREKEVRHDVMSHVYAYGRAVPEGKAYHSSRCDLLLCGDNTDIIIMTEALRIVRRKLVLVIRALGPFC